MHASAEDVSVDTVRIAWNVQTAVLGNLNSAALTAMTAKDGTEKELTTKGQNAINTK